MLVAIARKVSYLLKLSVKVMLRLKPKATMAAIPAEALFRNPSKTQQLKSNLVFRNYIPRDEKTSLTHKL